MVKKYDVYKVHKNKDPELVESNIGKILSRRITKQPDGKDYFFGYVPRGTKVTSRSSFKY